MQGTSRNNLLLQLPHVLLLALFAFPLLPLNISNILFIAFSVFVLGYWIYVKPLPIWKEIRFNLWLLLPFVPYLIEFALHPQSSTMAFEMQKKIPFFIAPFSIPVFIKLFGIKSYKPYFTSFTWAMIAISLYTIIMLVAHNILFNPVAYANGAFILRQQFEDYSRLHPTYFGLFAACAIFWIINEFDRYAKQWQVIYIAAAIIIVSLTLLVAAKMPLLILFFGTCGMFYFKIKDRKRLGWAYLTLLFFAVSVSFIVPSLKNRVSEVVVTSPAAQPSTIQERQLIFDCSKDIFLDHIFTGTGAAHAQQWLDNCYQSKSAFLEPNKYNAHNQYLTLGINYGIGIVVLFIISIIMFLRRIYPDRFGLIIAASALLIMLTESILERQMGVYFFLLFMLLLSNSKKRI